MVVAFFRRLFGCGLFLLFAAPAATAQVPLADTALTAFYDQLNAYRAPQYRQLPNVEAVLLPATFSGADMRALELRGRHILRIDLVYTFYHLDPAFNQRELNLKRIRHLMANLPGLLTDESITWTLVEQTGCNSPAECQPFFHGFVVYVAPHATAATSRTDLDSLTRKLRRLEKKYPRALKKKPRPKAVACNLPYSRLKARQMAIRLHHVYQCSERAEQLVQFKLNVDERGRTLGVELAPTRAPLCAAELAEAIRHNVVFASGIFIDHQRFPFIASGVVHLPVRGWWRFGRPDVAITGYSLTDSVARRYRLAVKASRKKATCVARLTKAGELVADTATHEPPLPPDANAVTQTMRRHPEWPKEAVVADVTGSMYPYTYDLMAWLQLSALQGPKTFVFFNDGDDRLDKFKRVGSTGGLYSVRTDRYDIVKGKLVEAMRAGGGGDPPENDAEALLHARHITSDSTELILIADNLTFPRDAKLLKGTATHVRIILCGVYDYINPRYLALACQPGFTLHTIEGDIQELSTLLDGEIITLQGQQYEVTKHGFRLVRKT